MTLALTSAMDWLRFRISLAAPPPPPPKPKLSKSEKLKQQLARTRPLPSSQPESRPYESDGELKTNRKGKA